MLRSQQEISQADLGQTLGVTSLQVENTRPDSTASKLEAIGDALGVPVSLFFKVGSAGTA